MFIQFSYGLLIGWLDISPLVETPKKELKVQARKFREIKTSDNLIGKEVMMRGRKKKTTIDACEADVSQR